LPAMGCARPHQRALALQRCARRNTPNGSQHVQKSAQAHFRGSWPIAGDADYEIARLRTEHSISLEPLRADQSDRSESTHRRALN
jgi:hypothetical protein